ICASSIEMAAAQSLLDEVHEGLPVRPADTNLYTLGSISNHNVVLVCLSSCIYGIASAAVISIGCRLPSFCSVQFVLMVGIGEG
ncbi:uncharacterized protein BO66DRAFT_297956, partial [Aspergillus aculeatinus CBS 121060]